MNTTELNAIERAARATSINRSQINRLNDECDRLLGQRNALLAALARALHHENTHWKDCNALDYCQRAYRDVDPDGAIERHATAKPPVHERTRNTQPAASNAVKHP